MSRAQDLLCLHFLQALSSAARGSQAFCRCLGRQMLLLGSSCVGFRSSQSWLKQLCWQHCFQVSPHRAPAHPAALWHGANACFGTREPREHTNQDLAVVRLLLHTPF